MKASQSREAESAKVCVVYGEEERATFRESGGNPVERMEDRERIRGTLIRSLEAKRSPSGAGPLENHFLLARRELLQPWPEQLSQHREGEIPFQLGRPRREHAQSGIDGLLACRGQQPGLSSTGFPFDRQRAAIASRCRAKRREDLFDLSLPLQQLLVRRQISLPKNPQPMIQGKC